MPAPNQAAVIAEELEFRGEAARSGPLTWGQLAIWDVLHWLPADDTSLTLTGSVPVPPGAGMAAVREALRALVERHESLRTSYHDHEGEPWQTARDQGPLSVIVRESDGRDVAGAVRLATHELRSLPFDLAADLPLRVCVVTRHRSPAAVALAVCHMAVDAWSLEIVLEDLSALLAAPSPDAAALPEAGQQPLERGAYEQSKAGQARERQALDYWRARVEEAPSTMLESLPQPVRPNLGWARIESPALADAVGRIARRTNAKPSTVVLAAVARLLARQKGERNAALRLIVATRFRPETRRLVGAFNQNALFVVPVDDEPFDAFVTRAAKASYLAYAHSEYDPRKVESLVSDLVQRRGLEPDGYCFFNDMTFRESTEPGEAPSPDPDATVVTEPDRDRFPKGATFFLYLMRLSGSAVLEICADRRFLAPGTVPGFLRDLADLAVAAADETAAP